ncbi:MAG: ABC transporter permease subunit [Acidimicrobiia bacterium]|nr:ABC transporter permease subunit [Acidimicrobiia bacterium]
MVRAYVARRLLQGLLVVLVVVSLMFVLFRVMPADPTAMLVYRGMPDEAAQRLLEQWGLTGSLFEQYVRYLGNLLQLDFGTSFFYNQPVFDVLGPRVLNTLVIAIPGTLLGATIGAIVGMVIGWRRGSATERSGIVAATFIRGTPSFVLGILLLMIFSSWLGWFPASGMASVGEGSADLDRFLSLDFLHHLALPLLAMTIFFIPENLLLMRTAVVEQRSEDYIELVAAKGVRERRVRWHAARNSLLPSVTWLFAELAETVAGIIIIEIVFSWPGVGRELVLAVSRLDFPVAQAAFFLSALMIVIANLLADLSYGYLDPRVVLE